MQRLDEQHRNGLTRFGAVGRFAFSGLSLTLGTALFLSTAWAQDEKPANDKAAPAEEKAAPAEEKSAPAEEKAAPAEEKPAAEKVPPELRGILPADVPLDLESDSFGSLDGAWEKWGQDLGELVQSLYTAEGLDKQTEADLVAKLQGKLTTIDKALGDSRYRSLYDALTSVRSRLARRLDLINAIRDTLNQNPNEIRTAQLNEDGKNLAAAVETLRRDVNSIAGGSAWLGYVQAEEISALSKNPTDTEKAIPVLQAVKDKLAKRDSLTDESQKKFLSRPGFAGLEKAIGSYLELATAPLASEDKTALRDELAKLTQGIEKYEESGLSEDASQIAGLLAAVSKVAPDHGRRIGSAVRLHYLNSNLQLVANERFLNRFVAESRNESGGVVDSVPGANVRGSQTTNTTVGVDVKPSNGGGQFNLTLSGRTQSNTTSYASQAMIFSTGDTQFWASKPVYFDGYQVRTGPASIDVNPNVYHYGARVPEYEGGLTGMLFGDTARSRALGVANSQRGQALAHSRQRVTESVLPRFDGETNKAMTDANASLQRFQQRLKDANVSPERTVVATSESAMRLQSTVKHEGELGGDAPPSAFSPNDDALLEIHESLINNALKQMNFAGKTMTDEDVRKEMERFLTIIAGKEVKLESSNPEKKAEEGDASEPRAFIFADKDPVRVKFEDGQVRLIIRAGFEQPGKENIPLQQVTVPLVYKVQGNQIEVSVEPNTVQVMPVEKPESTTQQLGFAGVVKKKVEKSIPSSKREARLNVERQGKAPIVLSVADIKALGGWLIVRLR